MNQKEKKSILSKRVFGLCIGLVIAASCLFFFINGWLELEDVEKNKKQELAGLDNSIEVKGQSLFIDGDEVYKFLPVPGGTIRINDSTGARTISVESFLLGEIPVSSRLQRYIIDNIKVGDGYVEKYMDFPSVEGTIDNWKELIEKLNKATNHKFRLPTNDEWEYAARGGMSSRNYKYAGGNEIERVAYYKENCSGLGNIRLRGKIPNELGFYDMSGCVWELTSTKIEDVFPDIKLLNTMAEMEREIKSYEGIKEYKDAQISRGGNYESPAEECALNFRSSTYRIKTGARLVMEY